jgi:hypothetical protein
MLMENEKGLGMIDAVVGAVVTIIGVLIVTNVDTAANLTGATATLTGLLGLVLAAGGILFIITSVFLR